MSNNGLSRVCLAGCLAIVVLTSAAAARAQEAPGGGIAFGVYLAGSQPTADGANHHNLGVNVAGGVGYEIPLGQRRITLTPQALVTYDRWAFDLGYNGEGVEDMVGIMVGARGTYYFWMLGLWAQLHLGYGSIGVELNGHEVASEGGIAVNFGAGADFVLMRFLALGVFLGSTKTVVEQVGSVQYGTLAFNFGFHVKIKIPM